MNLDTLLARQMELHTTLRRVPKTPEMLSELHTSFQEYQHFLNKLKQFARKLQTGTDTILQCLIYLGVGGASGSAHQKRDDVMRIHQAKVPEKAIKLENRIRELIPHDDLLGYVELANKLRNVYRMKVEDEKDLQRLEQSITEAIEYLSFLHGSSGRDADSMFALFMAEGAESLVSMLRTHGDHKAVSETAASSGGASSSVLLNSTPTPHGSEPPPSSSAAFAEALAAKCGIAGDAARPAGERLRCAHTILDWVAGAPVGMLSEQLPRLLPALAPGLDALMAEMRSSLCRLGCEAAAVLVRRAMAGLGADPSGLVGYTLGLWAATLARRVFVTVVAISKAADLALRELVLCSGAHLAVVRAVLAALEKGTQAELRRKGLGYLVLSLVSAREPAAVRRLGHLLAEPAQKYVLVGDTSIRKMARALCIVLAEVCHVALSIDEKTLRLIEQEKKHLLPLLNSPRDLEKILFGPRKEIFFSCPDAPSEPEVDLKPCSNTYHQSRVDSGTPHGHKPSRRLASQERRAQPPSINRIRLPDIIKKSKTQTAEVIMDIHEDPYPSGYSKPLMKRYDIYDTDADLIPADGDSEEGRTSSAWQKGFVLAVPKRSTAAEWKPKAMRKVNTQTKTENMPSQNVINSPSEDSDFSSLVHNQCDPTLVSLSDVSDNPQKLEGGGARANTRIVPLSLAGTTVCGRGVDYDVAGIQHMNSVAHSDITHGTQAECPETRMSNTLKRKIERRKP